MRASSFEAAMRLASDNGSDGGRDEDDTGSRAVTGVSSAEVAARASVEEWAGAMYVDACAGSEWVREVAGC